MALPAPASSVPVALLALAVLGSSAWACLLCFSTFTERLGVCRIFTGVQGPGREKCQKAFAAAFSGLEDSEINYDERSHLHDSFSQMIHSLQEAATAQGSYEVAFRDAAEKMKEVIARLKGVQACIPPCGLQEVARRFHCRGCFSTVCDLPLDCPGCDGNSGRSGPVFLRRELPAARGDHLLLEVRSPCVSQLRTQDTSYFRNVPRAHGYVARIRPVQPRHRGTFSCVIKHDQRLLARLYFFLNVTGPPPRGETELQIAFREVLRWAPRDAELIEPWEPSLGALLARPDALTRGLIAAAAAVASATATLLVWMFFRWYVSGN
ncbi:sperm acrosome membrane-associated protein 6 isoform X2 [Tupaia chinensis]|uniref:sperm acrosome membrane-associated protein 6 isoform X2 n=1 Tax=Tupaia chinensis TaxID=246437 RepID=UPI000FFB1246|nr:sperm acrosome membrane-associated protein 6 isoform X2 [Tupaia chinensis]